MNQSKLLLAGGFLTLSILSTPYSGILQVSLFLVGFGLLFRELVDIKLKK